MAATKAAEIYIANETGVTEIDGTRLFFQKGVTRLRAGAALLKACPNCFELLPEDGSVYWEAGERHVVNTE